MNPLLFIAVLIGAGALALWLIFAFVERLQKGKKKNTTRLEPGADESHNIDAPGD